MTKGNGKGEIPQEVHDTIKQACRDAVRRTRKRVSIGTYVSDDGNTYSVFIQVEQLGVSGNMKGRGIH